MASLNLQDGPREGRQEHPDYPDVPKEVPVDEDGVRKCTLLFPVSMVDVCLTLILVNSHRILFKGQWKSSDLGSKEVDRGIFGTERKLQEFIITDPGRAGARQWQNRRRGRGNDSCSLQL